jgi:hypothetical protein
MVGPRSVDRVVHFGPLSDAVDFAAILAKDAAMPARVSANRLVVVGNS